MEDPLKYIMNTENQILGISTNEDQENKAAKIMTHSFDARRSKLDSDQKDWAEKRFLSMPTASTPPQGNLAIEEQKNAPKNTKKRDIKTSHKKQESCRLKNGIKNEQNSYKKVFMNCSKSKEEVQQVPGHQQSQR